MKARLPKVRFIPQPTQKELIIESRKQCIEQWDKWEMETDTCWLYMIHKRYNKGRKALEEAYSEMFELREQMKAEFGNTDDELIGEFAMRWLLKEKGIDVEEMYRNNKERFNPRFNVRVK